MSETPRQFSDLSADTQDLLVIYRNLRHELVLLTAAGPLMERREKFSKLQDGERRGHEETTTVREQFRLLFKLREILIAEGVPLDIKMQPIKTESAPKPEPVRKAAAANATATAAAPPSPHAEEKLTRPHPEAAAAVNYVTPSNMASSSTSSTPRHAPFVSASNPTPSA